MQPEEAVQPGDAVGLESEGVQPGLAVQPRKAVACSASQSAARFGCAAWLGCWRDGSERTRECDFHAVGQRQGRGELTHEKCGMWCVRVAHDECGSESKLD